MKVGGCIGGHKIIGNSHAAVVGRGAVAMRTSAIVTVKVKMDDDVLIEIIQNICWKFAKLAPRHPELLFTEFARLHVLFNYLVRHVVEC